MRPKKYKPRRHLCLMCAEARRCYSSELALLNHVANEHLRREERDRNLYSQFSLYCFCGVRWSVPHRELVMRRRDGEVKKFLKMTLWSELARHMRDAGGFEQHYLAYRLGLSNA